MKQAIYKYSDDLILENGSILKGLEIAYHTFGTLNEKRDNVIWVCHALTANSNVFEWWPGLFGEHDLFNPEDHFIVCANNLGSCYGTTGPLSVNPVTGGKWFSSFPSFTIRDMARTLQLLKEKLGIDKINTIIGGSQGGQIAQEWSILYPNVTERLILIATNSVHSSWGIAFNESQRMAIKADPTYYSNTDEGGSTGLKAARSIALLSYRNYKTYEIAQEERRKINGPKAPATYQQYQGDKLAARFNAYSYVRLSEAMDSHDLCRGRCKNPAAGLHRIKVPTLVIGLNSDILFPVEEQQFMASSIPDAHFRAIDSDYGHDGFLLETRQISALIGEFFENTSTKLLLITN